MSLHRASVCLTTLLLMFAAPSLEGQRPAGEQLDRAVILYEELQLERAVTLLRDVLAPTQRTITPDERVRAMKYLGAAFALLGRRDSALAHFRGALERDPFVDLDPTVFTARERQVFADARERTFVAGARVMRDTGAVPGEARVVMQFRTTQQARVSAAIRRAGGGDSLVSFRWTGAGTGEVPWDGLDQHGARLPTGRYQLDVIATSVSGMDGDTVSVPFDVRYDHDALEDTLPALDPASLLPEQRPPSVAHTRLATGVLAAAVAVALPVAVGNGALEGTRSHSITIAGLTASGGVAGFLILRRHSLIPEHVRENARRRAERMQRNYEIRERNAVRLSGARMVVTPVLGEAR